MILLCLLLADPTVITRVRVEHGDGERIDDATVVIDKGRIVSVGGATAQLPSGARVIVAQGKTLTPGLIEPLSRIGISEVGGETDTRDNDSHAGISPAFRVSDGFNAQSLWIADAREEGITSAAVVPAGMLLNGTGNWLDTSRVLDPKPLAMFGGLSHRAARQNRGAAWMRIREIIADARFYRANKKAFDEGKTRALTLPLLQLEALLPVLDGSLLLVLHADRASDIEAAVELARAEKLRIAISGGAEAWRVRQTLAKAKVPVILQPSRQTLASFDALHARDDGATLLEQAGVQMVFTASAEEWVGRLRQEAGIAVSYGLPYGAAIRSITLSAAELYRHDVDVGTVREGKRANLVLWSGDPLELSSVAEHVFIDGVEQSLQTRHKELVKRYLQ